MWLANADASRRHLCAVVRDVKCGEGGDLDRGTYFWPLLLSFGSTLHDAPVQNASARVLEAFE